MPSAGTLTLNYNAGTRTFTATVTAVTGFNSMGVQLNAPNNGPSFGMSSALPGNNPSTWTYVFPAPPPPPMPDPVFPGTWSATGVLQGSGTAVGTTPV